MRSTGIALAAAAMLAVAIGVPAAASRATGGCQISGKTILARDSAAVVYSSRGAAYACANSAGRVYKLGTTSICIGTRRAGPFTLAGNVLAYGLTSCGIDASSTQVLVRSLSTGRTLHDDPDVSQHPAEAFGSVTSLVVERDGSDAWIATSRFLGRPPGVVQLWRHDSHGLTMLDSGAGLKLGSLRLRHSQLAWRDGLQTRHASLR